MAKPCLRASVLPASHHGPALLSRLASAPNQGLLLQAAPPKQVLSCLNPQTPAWSLAASRRSSISNSIVNANSAHDAELTGGGHGLHRRVPDLGRVPCLMPVRGRPR